MFMDCDMWLNVHARIFKIKGSRFLIGQSKVYSLIQLLHIHLT